jgi:precorrin-6A synthase
MRKILIIGMGAGNPDYMTVQAIEALNKVDVFFIPDKGHEKAALRKLRTDICARFIKTKAHRFVEIPVPKRAEDFSDYKANVADWHAEIEAHYARLLREAVNEDECAGFLVWGDPAIYDSTLRIIEKIHARREIDFTYDVIPGISAVQALAARHRVPLNRIGESIHITTGRKLADGYPAEADSVVVMLDGEQTFKKLAGDFEIYWGAYLGTEEEVLVSGRLSDVADEIAAIRAERRARNGWIMDSYLIRRPETAT